MKEVSWRSESVISRCRRETEIKDDTVEVRYFIGAFSVHTWRWVSSSNSKEVSKHKLVCGSCRRSLFRCVGRVCCSERLPFKARRCKRAATLALPSIKGCSSRKVTRSASGSSLFSAKVTYRSDDLSDLFT